MKCTQPRMYGLNGRGMWKMPARKAFAPEGIAPGATVTGYGRDMDWVRQQITGRVWSKGSLYSGDHSAYWWVVDADGIAWCLHESDMTVLSQITEQTELFSTDAARVVA